MMMSLFWALSLPFVAMVAGQDFCVSMNNVFHVKVNLFAGELGTYRPKMLMHVLVDELV
jgi:hypothetical protein